MRNVGQWKIEAGEVQIVRPDGQECDRSYKESKRERTTSVQRSRINRT